MTVECCAVAVNCSSPPARPGAGTWEWNGQLGFATEILYTCGPYGRFQSDAGLMYETLSVTCAWNRTWSPPQLDPCVGRNKPATQQGKLYSFFFCSLFLSDRALPAQGDRDGLHA